MYNNNNNNNNTRVLHIYYYYIILFGDRRVPCVYITYTYDVYTHDDRGCWSVHTPARARVPRAQCVCVCLCVRVFVCALVYNVHYIIIILYTSFNIKISNTKVPLYYTYSIGAHARGWRRGSSSVVIISGGIDTTAEWTHTHTHTQTHAGARTIYA
jgi:hypothetical protein